VLYYETMSTEPEKQNEVFTPQMALVINARIPIEEALEGEELYRQLSEMLKAFCEKTKMFGQIIETLEPCCQEKKDDKLA